MLPLSKPRLQYDEYIVKRLTKELQKAAVTPEMLEELENKNFENVPYRDWLLECYELTTERVYLNRVCQVLESATPKIQSSAEMLQEISASVDQYNAERAENAIVVQTDLAQIEEDEGLARVANQQCGDYQQILDQANATKSKIEDACKEMEQLNQQVIIFLLIFLI